MNERIRELFKPIRKSKHTSNLMSNPPQVRYSYTIDEEDIKKFAELIVRECINIGDNYEEILGNEPECFNCRKVAYGIVDKIKNHFGVGE